MQNSAWYRGDSLTRLLQGVAAGAVATYFFEGIIAPLTRTVTPGAAGPSREASDWGLSKVSP